jgi:hypothetical protein
VNPRSSTSHHETQRRLSAGTPPALRPRRRFSNPPALPYHSSQAVISNIEAKTECRPGIHALGRTRCLELPPEALGPSRKNSRLAIVGLRLCCFGSPAVNEASASHRSGRLAADRRWAAGMEHRPSQRLIGLKAVMPDSCHDFSAACTSRYLARHGGRLMADRGSTIKDTCGCNRRPVATLLRARASRLLRRPARMLASPRDPSHDKEG